MAMNPLKDFYLRSGASYVTIAKAAGIHASLLGRLLSEDPEKLYKIKLRSLLLAENKFGVDLYKFIKDHYEKTHAE